MQREREERHSSEKYGAVSVCSSLSLSLLFTFPLLGDSMLPICAVHQMNGFSVSLSHTCSLISSSTLPSVCSAAERRHQAAFSDSPTFDSNAAAALSRGLSAFESRSLSLLSGLTETDELATDDSSPTNSSSSNCNSDCNSLSQ